VAVADPGVAEDNAKFLLNGVSILLLADIGLEVAPACFNGVWLDSRGLTAKMLFAAGFLDTLALCCDPGLLVELSEVLVMSDDLVRFVPSLMTLLDSSGLSSSSG
jgi:hypothetical protein